MNLTKIEENALWSQEGMHTDLLIHKRAENEYAVVKDRFYNNEIYDKEGIHKRLDEAKADNLRIHWIGEGR